MAIVDLDAMKQHLGVTDDADDTLIEGKIDAAQRWIESNLGYAIEAEFPDEVPADIVEAIKMQAAHFYENREAVTAGVTLQTTLASVDDVIRNRRAYSWE